MTHSSVIRFLRAAALAALLVAAAVPARTQPSNTRTRVDVLEMPWRAIGKLQAVAGSLRTTCTAALVGPRTVLSAAHCLYNVRTRRFFPPSSLHFVAGLEGQGFAAAAVAEALTTGPGYDPDDADATRGSDWALITLTAPMPAGVPLLPLGRRLPTAGAVAMIGGYARDNPNVLTADTGCHVTGFAVDGRGRRLILHDCAAMHGVSGAPLLVKGDAGWSIVGINVARAGAIGLAVTLDEIQGRL